MAHVQGRRRSPEAHSNLCSRLFFTWASPLFALANRKVRVGPVLSGLMFRDVRPSTRTRCHHLYGEPVAQDPATVNVDA